MFSIEASGNIGGPIGKLDVPFTGEYSIAVDPTYIPLGLSVFLSMTKSLSTGPIRKLVFT